MEAKVRAACTRNQPVHLFDCWSNDHFFQLIKFTCNKTWPANTMVWPARDVVLHDIACLEAKCLIYFFLHQYRTKSLFNPICYRYKPLLLISFFLLKMLSWFQQFTVLTIGGSICTVFTERGRFPIPRRNHIFKMVKPCFYFDWSSSKGFLHNFLCFPYIFFTWSGIKQAIQIMFL